MAGTSTSFPWEDVDGYSPFLPPKPWMDLSFHLAESTGLSLF